MQTTTAVNCHYLVFVMDVPCCPPPIQCCSMLVYLTSEESRDAACGVQRPVVWFEAAPEWPPPALILVDEKLKVDEQQTNQHTFHFAKRPVSFPWPGTSLRVVQPSAVPARRALPVLLHVALAALSAFEQQHLARGASWVKQDRLRKRERTENMFC